VEGKFFFRPNSDFKTVGFYKITSYHGWKGHLKYDEAKEDIKDAILNDDS
jgi:hypothetical protein